MRISDEWRELIAYAKQAGYHWEERSDLKLIFASGDPDFIINVESNRYVVRKSERGILYPPEMITHDTQDLEKYLSWLFGSDVRRRLGWLDQWFTLPPISSGETRDGYRFNGEPDALSISWEQDGGQHHASGFSTYRAEDFFVYSRFSALEIRDSFRNEDGYPIFTNLPPGVTLQVASPR